MTSNEILKADVLDILFDNRNKQYGAYTLRKDYNYRLTLALVISLSAILSALFLISIRHPINVTLPKLTPDILVKTIETPRNKIPEIFRPIKKVQAQEVRQKQFTRIVIVDKKDIVRLSDIRELETDAISNKTVDGPILNRPVPIITETIASDVTEEKKAVSSDGPIQREPEFPGGQAAWLNFLQKNLIAPEDLEPGDKKMVTIKFQVSAEGMITNFEIIQSAGKLFDNEVIRVLKKMPKWKPAIQNGQPVAKAFSQPVTFVGIEQ